MLRLLRRSSLLSSNNHKAALSALTFPKDQRCDLSFAWHVEELITELPPKLHSAPPFLFKANANTNSSSTLAHINFREQVPQELQKPRDSQLRETSLAGLRPLCARFFGGGGAGGGALGPPRGPPPKSQNT